MTFATLHLLIIGIIVVACIVAALYAIGQCNGRFGLKSRFNNAFAQIDVQLMSYNTKHETFPSSFIADMFQFGQAELFQIDNAEEKQAPKVSFT